MLCQPQGQQSLDEDGVGAGAGGPCKLYSWSTGAQHCAQTHQSATPGQEFGVPHRQYHRYHGRSFGKG